MAIGCFGSPVFRAGTTYFLLVFAAAFLCGCIRVPFLVPLVGNRSAELMEMPVMLLVIAHFSKYIVQRFQVGTGLWVGAIGLVLMMLTELGMMYAVSGSRGSILEQIQKHDPVSGIVFLVVLGIYAVMPMLHVRMGRNAAGSEVPKVQPEKSDCTRVFIPPWLKREPDVCK